jgi:hypothetical protein
MSSVFHLFVRSWYVRYSPLFPQTKGIQNYTAACQMAEGHLPPEIGMVLPLLQKYNSCEDTSLCILIATFCNNSNSNNYHHPVLQSAQR